MKIVLGLILISVLISTYSTWGDYLNPKKWIPQTKESVTTEKSSNSQPISKESLQKGVSQDKSTQIIKSPTSPSISIDSYIKFGPRPNELVSNTNKVTFEFGAVVSPKTTEGQITYDTKLEGFESAWQETYSTERTIELPGGVKQYTFWVRAKIKEKGITDQTPATLTFTLNVSPYFGKIKISQVTLASAEKGSLIVLNTYLGSNEKIDITGWKLSGKRGNVLIPQGIENYNPLVQTLQSQNIIVKQNDVISVSSDPNPLGGSNWSFRTNKCFGYLKNSHTFPIYVSDNCPRVQSDKLPSYLEKCCREYLSTLWSCQQPTFQKMESYGILKDSNCFTYLTTNFSYKGCYANYYQTKDFWENSWHIYLNNRDREIMDIQCDVISLYDKNGLLVNKYEYGSTRCTQ